ncbi:MAG: TerB family tellurite resistance protein [Candidatus Viridilinea halotolerans]|uniref:TerB family tellurite resistance protein n=1 Tax=Candidatus Viridilinea halotolerans TaxID=2491704 RepID=A0A426U2T5_9CHLR|nr:MAG: TerB family tellurite resistance protein [Candidatus Viridilinea halotolerans]
MSKTFWGQALDKLDETRKEAERLARETQERLEETGKFVKDRASGVSKDFVKTVAGVAGEDSVLTGAVQQAHQTVFEQPDVAPVDVTQLPERLRVAFAGALFAMADADGSLDKEELQLIFQLTDLEGLNQRAKQTVLSYIMQPPAFAATLVPFASESLTLRCALLLNLLEVAIANDLVSPSQEQLLADACVALAINPEQYAAIGRFQSELRQMRLRGVDDGVAAETAKNAVAGLSAVGIPIAAVYASGSVIGLSAAGITSGLAAVGLGLGMVPGIGVAVLLGTGIFMGVRYMLDAGQGREKERLHAEALRKAQLVIMNLQEAVQLLADRMQDVQAVAATAEANREALLRINDRIRILQQMLARRKDTIEAIK